MGRDLFDRYPEITEQASDILGYSIDKLCRENPNRLLDETQYTQPAIFVVNALSYRHAIEGGADPADHFLGHSLGEYNALHAADVLDFATALRMVKKRGEAMGRASDGAMAAVTGLGRADVERALAEHGLGDDLEVANDNAPDQVVIAGSARAVAAARETFEALPGAPRYTPLRTSGAFHSRRMASARDQFARYLTEVGAAVEHPRVPVIANSRAAPYQRDEVHAILVEQITGTVRWLDSVRHLLDRGEDEFVEVGVGRVLTGLLDRIRGQAAPHEARVAS